MRAPEAIVGKANSRASNRISILSAAAVLLAACGHRAPPPPLGTPSMRSIKLYLPPEITLVPDGGGEIPQGLDRRFREAVHGYLKQAGLTVVSQTGVATDAALTIEGRLNVYAKTVRGSVSVTVWGANGVVEQLRWGVLKPLSAFLHDTSYQLVSETLRSPRFTAYADARTGAAPAQVGQVPPIPRLSEPTAPSRDQAIAEARAHSDRATAAYRAGRYAEALTEYHQANAVVADPVLLFNVAQCHRKLGHRAEAIEHYRRYLREAPEAQNRSEVEKRIAELEREERAK